MYPIFGLCLLFFFLLLVAIFIFGGIVIVHAAERTVKVGSDWIAQRQEQGRQRTVLAQTPETSLLRAGQMPTSSHEVLVRPVAETPITATEELLRVSKE